jgi:hypothetical protein
LKKGEKYTVEKVGRALVVTRGHVEIARSNNAPAELIDAVEAQGNIAQAVVEEVYDVARVADISLCKNNQE